MQQIPFFPLILSYEGDGLNGILISDSFSVKSKMAIPIRITKCLWNDLPQNWYLSDFGTLDY